MTVLQQLWIRTGTSQAPHLIPVHHLASRHGKDVCKVLPAIHTLTGSDYTSKFGTKPAAMKADASQYLIKFGAKPLECDTE